MSNIGMTNELAYHDEYSLVSVEGGSDGSIRDCEGDTMLHVPAAHLKAAEQCFPLIVAMYRKGQRDGESTGKIGAQFAMRKALGL